MAETFPLADSLKRMSDAPFSLDEAARVRFALTRDRHAALCPRCRGPLTEGPPTQWYHGSSARYLRCPACRRFAIIAANDD